MCEHPIPESTFDRLDVEYQLYGLKILSQLLSDTTDGLLVTDPMPSTTYWLIEEVASRATKVHALYCGLPEGGA